MIEFEFAVITKVPDDNDDNYTAAIKRAKEVSGGNKDVSID